jgi:flagellar basal body-associated protein FliL
MEPNLEEMSDYKKPLSKKKTKTIIIAFLLVLAIYAAYAVIMRLL